MAKYLDKTGLDLLVNNYLKPETEYSLTSVHPVQNKVLTQTLGNLLSIIDYSKSTGYFHYANAAALPTVNSTGQKEGDFEYNPEKELKIGQRAILDDTQAVMEISAIDSETGAITWTNTGLSFGGQVIQVETIPTASAEEEGKIYQYIGATTSTYTNGHFYKCVSDGEDPATYSWVNIPVQDVPTKVSDLTNDLNFIDNTVNDLVNYTTTTDLNDALDDKANKATTLAGYGITDAYTKTEIDTKVSSVYRYKGSVQTYADLPSSDQVVGDVYNIETADPTHSISAGDNVAWNGTTWDKLGGDIDLSDYYTKTQTDTLLDDKVDKVTGKGLSTEDYTTAEKTKLAGLSNYILPSATQNALGGIKIWVDSANNLQISTQ